MAITQKDIARQLGISRALVGYALNGNPRVSEETRRDVQQTAQRLGYRPNRAARALVTGRSGQIALCFQWQGSFTDALGRYFQVPARADGYDLLVSSIAAVENAASPLSMDGAIFFSIVPEPLLIQGFPVVSLQIDERGWVAAELDRCDVIQVVLEDAARDAMRHLMEEGCRRIAYVSVRSMMTAAEPRYRAYSTFSQNIGQPVEEIAVESSDYADLRQATQQALELYCSRHGFPDALFCSSDDIAVGAYRALRRMGRSIPQETAVVGCDDIEESRDHCPALTTIAWPFDLICRRAWQMLMERIADPSLPPRLERVKAELLLRASSQQRSTSTASTRNADISAAMPEKT